MSYLLITDFIAGLDTRKSRFTAAPGSLRLARNVHLTRGGEIEVRKMFVPTYHLPPGLTKGVTTVRGQLYVFGSGGNPGVPAGVYYQQLANTSGGTLLKILSTDNFNGKIYAVAEFTDGAIHHYYDGVRVTDWDELSAQFSSINSIAPALAAKVDALDEVIATANGLQIVVTAGVAGVPFNYDCAVVNGGATTDQTLTKVLNQANVPAVQAKQATGTVTVTGGTGPESILSSLKVNGVELLSFPVVWSGSHEDTASVIAQQINLNNTTPDYTASVSGAIITITADLAGSSVNGYQITDFSTGGFTVSTSGTMQGGANFVPAVAQVVTFTVGGTYEALDSFYIYINTSVAVVQGGSTGTATFVKTLGDKMYAVNNSFLHFSGFTGTPPVPDPTQWTTDVTGAGFTNMSTQEGGSSQLTGLAVYQNKLAVFSRRATQIWSVDADEANNQQVQVLANIGTDSPRTISSFGEQDVFFLSASGIRSLRARDSSNLASADDVGSSIDGEVLEFMKEQDEQLVRAAVAVAEPFDGRYLMAIAGTIYVFSHFAGSKVNAWTTYELEEMGPGAVVTDLAVTGSNLVARVGDTLCLYGGNSGQVYAANQEFEYEVQLPFLDAGQPGQTKTLEGVEVGAEGFWSVYLALDPQQPDVTELIANIKDSTYGSWGRNAAIGQSTHFSLTLKSRARGYARLANLMIYFTGTGE